MNKLDELSNYYKTDKSIDWNKIIDNYTPYVKTVINNMSNNNLTSEDIEEITLDAFFILWKNQDKLYSALSSYIAGITRNLVKEKLRKTKTLYNISDFENILTDSNLDMYSNEIEKISKIEKEFSKLKQIDLDIVNMFYYYGMSLKEISKVLNISEFNVSTRLYRIRKKVKKNLKMGGKNE